MRELRFVEKEEMFQEFMCAGMNPMWCDTPVPYYDVSVQAGIPTYMECTTRGEYLMFPRELVKYDATVVFNVRGDSMKDADLADGDQVSMELCEHFTDGDMVIASIDGEYTVKNYFVDQHGEHWLVPRNDRFTPIHLTEDMDVHFYGRVTKIMKSPIRTSYREMAQCVRQAKEAEKEVETPTDEQMEVVVRHVAERVKTVRQWYAVYRALVSKCALREGDYELFVSKVTEWLPQHPHPIDARELRRMESMSFRKSPLLWDRENAPVTGKRFDDYHQIAIQVMEELDKM